MLGLRFWDLKLPHLPDDRDLVAEAHEAAHVDVQAVQRYGGGHEVVVCEAKDVEVPRRALRVFPEEAELVATLQARVAECEHAFAACLDGMIGVQGGGVLVRADAARIRCPTSLLVRVTSDFWRSAAKLRRGVPRSGGPCQGCAS